MSFEVSGLMVPTDGAFRRIRCQIGGLGLYTSATQPSALQRSSFIFLTPLKASGNHHLHDCYQRDVRLTAQIKMEQGGSSFGFVGLGSRTLPSAKSTSPEATATAEPLDDPPGSLPGAAGFVGVPKCSFSPRMLYHRMQVEV